MSLIPAATVRRFRRRRVVASRSEATTLAPPRLGADSLTLLAALALLLAAPAARADDLPPQLEGVKFEPLLKEQIPLDVPFRDEHGDTVTLGDYCGKGKPVVLMLVQYRCPALCGHVLNRLAEGLRNLAGRRGFKIGEHFTVVTVSFDEREGPELAAAKKAAYTKVYDFPGAEAGWHFLTGDKIAIDKLTARAGFGFRYDPKRDQFLHDTGILLLTPKGRISRFFGGFPFKTNDLYYGLVEASQYRIGKPVDRLVLTFCYGYDPVKGTYQFTIMNVVRIAGAVTVVALAGLLFFLFRRERRPGAVDRPLPQPLPEAGRGEIPSPPSL